MSDVFSDARFLARLRDFVTEAVKSKIDEDFIRQVIEELVRPTNKHMRVTVDDLLMLEEKCSLLNFGVGMPTLTIYPLVLDKASQCVTKLHDFTLGYLGSFVYVRKDMGICAFHSILCRRKILSDHGLYLADGTKVEHVASYPFYDLSIFKVLSTEEHPYLTFGSETAIQVGTSLFLASFPALDNESARSRDEEVVATPGKIVRVRSVVGSVFVAASYACSRGSSGGAVLDKTGHLLGMHVQNLYALDDAHYQPMANEAIFPEDYVIKATTTNVMFLSANDNDKKLKETTSDKLARHAIANIGEKSGFGCFLPVGIIGLKVEACLLWSAGSSQNMNVE